MTRFLSLISQFFSLRKPGTTVRYMFSAVFSIAVLLGATLISSTEVSYIRLEASKTTIEAGEQFSLDVYAYAHVPVNAVDITLRFDKNAVDILGVDKGLSVLTIWTEEPIIEVDKVILRGGTFKKGFIKEHKIATVKLRAKETGQSTVTTSNVMLLAGDGKGSTVKVAGNENSELNLYIYDENTDPSSIGVDVKVSVLTDINGDGQVTFSDISAFMAAWRDKSTIFDFSGDGRMSFKDFSILLSDFFFK